MAFRAFVTLGASLILLGCAGGVAIETESADDPYAVSGPQTFGAADNAMQIKHVLISRQPDAAGFAEAGASGIGVVINTRVPGELDWDEEAVVESAGMLYYNVPISRQGDSLNADALHRITEIVMQHRDQQILMHCGSGNRVSAWLATHLVEDHKLGEDQAIAIAHQTGLTSGGLEQRVRTYLDDFGPAAADAAE